MTQGAHATNEEERRRPGYCYEEHINLARRVGDTESEIRVIRAEFTGVKDQVFTMQSMMTTVSKNVSEMNTAAQVMSAEMKGVKDMMALIHKYENAGGVVETAKRISAVIGLIVQVGALAGLVWGFLMFAKRFP